MRLSRRELGCRNGLSGVSSLSSNRQRLQQRAGCQRDFVHGDIERLLVDARGLAVAADLAHELKGGSVQLFIRGGGVRASEGLDA